MAEKMTIERAAGLLEKDGFHCSQAVMLHCAEVLGLDTDLMLKTVSGLGGGCFAGSVCGCVSGAICGIGTVHGFCKPGSSEQDAIMVAKVKEFEQKFTAQNGAITCKELLGGYNLSIPEEAQIISEKNLYQNCPTYIATACAIWDEVMGIEYDK